VKVILFKEVKVFDTTDSPPLSVVFCLSIESLSSSLISYNSSLQDPVPITCNHKRRVGGCGV